MFCFWFAFVCKPHLIKLLLVQVPSMLGVLRLLLGMSLLLLGLRRRLPDLRIRPGILVGD